MDARSLAWRVSVCLTSLSLAACGGGGGSMSALPAPAGASGANSAGAAAVALSIAIPSAATSAQRRAPRYVSAATKSVVVSFGGARQSGNCSATCSLMLSVVPGTVTFAVDLYDGPDGTGNRLSTGSTTTTVVAGQQNTVKLSFSGVVAKVGVTLGATSVSAGQPASIPVTVTAQDAAGYTIVGADPYATPIALATDDTSGATALSTTSVASPASTVTLNYNGAAAGSVHVSANAGNGATAQSAALSVQSPAPPPPAASSGPPHETTWYYYGLNDVNASIPASWMAAHADYVEDDGVSAQHAEAFKDAGGKFAVAYTDPAYVPYCFAPFSGTGAACQGPIGNLVTDEAGWFHLADGTRVRRYVDAHFGYQEALNPGSAAAQNAYRTTTQRLLQSAPKLDYFFADDTGGVYIGSDGTQMSGWFYGFNGPAVEITSDAQFIAAQRQLFAAATKPLIVNGVDPSTLQPSYGGAWVDSPNVGGQFYEGCYADGSTVMGSSRNHWVLESNSILTAIAHRTKAVCMMTAPATQANRVYELASWWLTYAPPYSVAAPAAAMPDGLTVLPEYEIVPGGARTTATTDISALRTASGAYVREFTACYQDGAAIGACAAVVNPSAATVAMPALSGRYGSALVLDDRSAFGGGAAKWTGSVPVSLPPLGAAILHS